MGIEVFVNGRAVETAAQSLRDLVAEQQLSSVRVATALNGRFVPEPSRDSTRLNAGDRVEIVSPRQGG